MAAGWIQFDKSLPLKTEVFSIATLTGLSCDDVIGKLLRFWSWLDDITEDGIICGLVDGSVYAVVDSIVAYPGFADALAKVGWISMQNNGSLAVPNYERHMGESSKARMLKNERQRRYRENAINNPDVDAQPTTVPSPEKRREENRIEQLNTVKIPVCPYPEIQAEWNRLCCSSGLPKCTVMSDDRKRKTLKYWKQSWFRENWAKIFDAFHRDDWRIKNPENANYDIMFKGGNPEKFNEISTVQPNANDNGYKLMGRST